MCGGIILQLILRLLEIFSEKSSPFHSNIGSYNVHASFNNNIAALKTFVWNICQNFYQTWEFTGLLRIPSA